MGDLLNPKVQKGDMIGSLFNAGLGSLVVAELSKGYMGNDFRYLLYTVGASSIGLYMYDLLAGSNKYKKLFKAMGLCNKDKVYPIFKKRQETGNGYQLLFSLPAGLSTKDFESHKQAIQQYLNVPNIHVNYANHNIFLDISDAKLEDAYGYELPEIKGEMQIVIGYSIDGLELCDLTREPHLLIAGATGSGKSYLLRQIITSAILAYPKEKVRLHLIDLKMGTEFKLFEGNSHVASFSKSRAEAEKTLYKMIAEVERRYKLFFQHDCVDITEYNRKFKKKQLPHELIIIDEFADLSSEKNSMEIIERLGCIARASGVHLIASTQRPSADTINGNIKSNLGTNIVGLKTINQINSMIIIGRSGLEFLKGKGHGILQRGNEEKEIQVMDISASLARSLLKQHEEKENPDKKKGNQDGVENVKARKLSKDEYKNLLSHAAKEQKDNCKSKQGIVKDVSFLDKF